MSTLYRPVEIVSAEQAEALPEGSIALAQLGPTPTKGTHGYWQDPLGGGLRDPAWAVGLTALVPIEVQEIPERFRDYLGKDRHAHRSVYRTAWQEADQ